MYFGVLGFWVFWGLSRVCNLGVYFGGWGGAEIGGISGGWFCQGFRGILGVSGNRGILGGGGI